MEKKTLNQLLSFILMAFVLNACSEKVLEEKNDELSIEENGGIIYPLVNNTNIYTRSSLLLANDWENITHVILPKRDSVATPWAHTLGEPSNHNIPLDVAEDIKKEDGWELIAHTMTPTATLNSNYLIFHNYITGILKVFYYVNGNPSGNNTGFWKLEFSGNQRMLNFADEIADPLTYGGNRKSIIVSNLIRDEHKGFTRGWNCFQAELSYDPNFITGTMSISAYNSNTQSVDLGGIYEESATGSIVSQSSKSSNTSGSQAIGNLLGKAADAWLKKQVNNGSIKQTSQTRAISPVVIATAVKAVSSLIAKKKGNSNDYQTIQLKTEGKIRLTGTIISEAASIVLPINLSCSVSQVGALGGWNLQVSPTLHTMPGASHYYNWDGGDQEYVTDGFYRLTTNVIRNPKAAGKISNQKVGYDYIQYSSTYKPSLSDEYNNFDGGSLYDGYSDEIMFMEEIYRKSVDHDYILIYSGNGQAKVTCLYGDVGDWNGYVLDRIDVRTTPIRGGDFGYRRRYGDKRVFARINFQYDATINGVKTTFMNSKTFYPRYDW